MSSKDVAIAVRGLGKSYKLAHKVARLATLREAIQQRLRHPFGRAGMTEEVFWALRDIDFDIPRGEVVGVIGNNGAGKSTLLKLLSRITHPTAGGFRIAGRIGSLLEVGTGFHPELTGRENVYLNGAILGMSRREVSRKFDEIVAFAEVQRFLDTPVKRYSSGMYVRLAFAVAASFEPEILIVDEVLSVGDAAFQRKCLGKIRDVTRSGERTVLFVSHHLTTVRSLCDRVLWLKKGRMYLDGPAGPTIERYLTEEAGGDANVFALDEAERSYSGEAPARLLRMAVNDGDHARHGEPLTIDIDFRASQTCTGVAFGVMFSSLEGGRVMCIDSDIPGPRLYDLPADSAGRMTLKIAENHLQPGRYLLTVIIRSGELALDVINNFAQIQVFEGPSTPTILIARGEAGSVRMPSECILSESLAPAAVAAGVDGEPTL